MIFMCLFCDIIKGDIPSFKIYEDENVYAFLDISDDCIGHTLVVTKRHCDNILDVDDELLSRLMVAVKKIAKHYVDDCGFSGVNIINNSGVDAGQSVMHLHIHILPRKDGDGISLYDLKEKMGSNFEEVQKELKLD